MVYVLILVAGMYFSNVYTMPSYSKEGELLQLEFKAKR